MELLAEILNICGKAVLLFGYFGLLLATLCLVRWSSEAGTKGKRNNRQRVFGRGGRALGRASAADDMNAVREARIANNRLQLCSTLAKEGKKKTKQVPIASPVRRKRSPPRSVSPRSVMEVPCSLNIPEELRPKSTKHFFVQGATKFIALPPLARTDEAVAILRRLSQEFMPIIHKHGFNIRSVSEMCCCGDGLEYELGGERRSVPAGESIVGNDHDSVAGYNGKLIDSFGRAEHVIHLRLRKVEDHLQFMDYVEIIDTMAHELAHCVHEDHGPEFWDLMEQILDERAKVVEDAQKNGFLVTSKDPVAASKEQFKGFDIYQSVSGQLRNWNGQVMISAKKVS